MGSATDGTDIVSVHVDPNYKDHWKREPVYGILCGMVDGGAKVVIGWDNGTEKKLLTKRGPRQINIQTIHMSEPDEDGMQWVEHES